MSRRSTTTTKTSKYKAILQGLARACSEDEGELPPPRPSHPTWRTLLMLTPSARDLASLCGNPQFPLHLFMEACTACAAAGVQDADPSPDTLTRTTNALQNIALAVACLGAAAAARAGRGQDLDVGYEFLSQFAPFARVDALFVQIVGLAAHVLSHGAQVPSPLVGAGVSVLLALATVTPAPDQNALIEFLTLVDVLHPMVGALAAPVVRVKYGGSMAKILTVVLSHLRGERGASLFSEMAQLDTAAELGPLLDLVTARTKVSIARLSKALAGSAAPSRSSSLAKLGALSVKALARLSKVAAPASPPRPVLKYMGVSFAGPAMLKVADPATDTLAVLLASKPRVASLLPPLSLFLTLVTSNKNVGALLASGLELTCENARAAASSSASASASASTSASTSASDQASASASLASKLAGWMPWAAGKGASGHGQGAQHASGSSLGYDHLGLVSAYVVLTRHILALPEATPTVGLVHQVCLLGLRAVLESRQLGPLLVDRPGHALELGDGNGRAPIAIHIMVLAVEAAVGHVLEPSPRSPPFVLVTAALTCTHRAMVLMRRYKTRMEIAWPRIVRMLLAVLDTLTLWLTGGSDDDDGGGESSRSSGGSLHTLAQCAAAIGSVVLVLNFMVQYGADFLPSSRVYDEVILILALDGAGTVQRLPVAMRELAPTLSRLDPIRGLGATVVYNLVEIVDHYAEPLAGRRTKSWDQGLAVIAAHFDSLVLSLDETVGASPRWSESDDAGLVLRVSRAVIENSQLAPN